MLSLSPPSVVTDAAGPISATGATLNGLVNPNGSTAVAAFQYSTDPAFPPAVPQSIGSGFSGPIGVALNEAGGVFVADTGDNTVKEVLPGGTIEIIGSGFSQPTGVAVDTSGDVFVADYGNNVVDEVLPGGTIKTIGSGFSHPYGVAVNASGEVFVADYGNNAVKEVLPGGTIETIGSGFANPTGVAVDAAGDVFVADYGNSAVKEVLPGGTIKTIGSGLSSPRGVAVDELGDVFIGDTSNSAVKELLPGGTIKTDGSGFKFPYGVAVDAAGDVFVGDTGNSRVVELSPPTVAATPSPLSGSTAAPVSGTLTGLTTGTTYYYRVEAANAAGAIADAQQPPKSFTTQASPRPQTNPVTYVLGPGATLSGSGATGVSAYDASNDGMPQDLVANLVSTTTNGRLTLNADGSFTYTPGPTFQGIDRFTYDASEGAAIGNTVTVTLLSSNASLVDKLYQQVLHRPAEDGGLEYWTGLLGQGQPLDLVAQNIFNSAERLDPLVTRFYETYLLRGPDSQGLAHWVADWQTKGDPSDVVLNILSSPEFFNDAVSLYGTVMPDHNEDFVRLLYQRALDRSSDNTGLLYWTQKLDALQIAPIQAAAAFYGSHEDHVDLVNFLYGEYFNGATPTAAEAAPYVADLDTGQTETQVELAMIDSAPYQNTPPEPAAGSVGTALYPH